MSDDTNVDVVEIFENVLGRPLEDAPRIRGAWNAENLVQVGYLLEGFLGSVRLPDKPSHEIRPAFFRRGAHWTVGAGNNDPYPLNEIKRALLYSDQVALDLLPIVGRARGAQLPLGNGAEDQYFAQQTSAELIAKIAELAPLKNLLLRRTVLPFFDPALRVAGATTRLVDPAFGTIPEAEAYVAQVRESAIPFISQEIRSPFYSAFIAQVPSIDETRVSWKDLEAIRNDEEIFVAWRDLIHGTLRTLYDARADFSDTEGEFRIQIRERLREWNARADVIRAKSKPLQHLWTGAKQVAIGWVGGAIAGGAYGAVFGPEVGVAGAIVGGVANAGPPLLQTIGSVHEAFARREARLGLEHHILALSG